MRARWPRLNPHQGEVVMVFWGKKLTGGKGHISPFEGGHPSLVTRVCNLGMILDLQLLFDHHIAAVTQSAFYHLHLARNSQPYLSDLELVTVIYGLVTSRLDYCNMLRGYT